MLFLFLLTLQRQADTEILGGVDQWLGYQCLAGGLSLPCARYMVDLCGSQ